MVNRELSSYVDEVVVAYERLVPDKWTENTDAIALTLLNFAVSMRNADYMNQNIVGDIKVKEI